MEAGRSLLSTPSPPSQPRNQLRTHITSSVSSKPAPSAAGNFPRSVIPQESSETYKGCYFSKEEKSKLETTDKKKLRKNRPLNEGNKEHLEDFESNLLYWSQPREFTLTDRKAGQNFEIGQLMPSLSSNLSEKGAGAKHKSSALRLDKRKEESYKREISAEVPVVRSNRLMERRLKKRKVTEIPRYATCNYEVSNSSIGRCKLSKKIERCLDSSDPLRFFSWGLEYRKFLTSEEEREAIIKIQDVIWLEGVKERFKSQFNREPTPIEWARAVGLSCRAIDSGLLLGKCSLKKIVNTNFRLVLHIAKQHVGNGIDIEDLIQEGNKGLMKSLRKFKISKGNRFKTYAHWWIRQSIRQAIRENSRTIRLPGNVFDLLRKIKREKKLCILEGCAPENEEIARRVGITSQKLRSVLCYGREPVSLNDRAFTSYCENVTYQEITADPSIEQPDIAVMKMLMRQHVRECLNILKPRERIIIEYRFGIAGRERKSLDEVGRMFGLTRERIRQIQSRAMQKLRAIASREDLSAYTMFLN